MQKHLLAFLFVFTFQTVAFAQALPCHTPTKDCEAVLEIVPGGKLTYTRTFDLEKPNPAVTSAILMVHASDRLVSWGYKQLNALIAKGMLSKDTLIVAPLLPAPADKPAAGFLYWGANDWSGGFDSLDATHTSSFLVLDLLIRKMLSSGNFPNLKTLIVTGFSAGGQATQRFAVGTEIDHEFPNVRFRYIVGSPSSYVYLNEDRWVPGTENQFAKPVNPGCAYNSYRYGGEKPNKYMSQRPFAKMVENFIARDLAFIVGELDDATTHPNPPIQNDVKDSAGLDISCEAKWQGASRLQRSYLFHQYLTVEFPQNKHVWFSVPGWAHTYRVYDDVRTVDLLNFK